MTDPDAEHEVADLIVVRGDPTPEELAALVVVLGSRRSGTAPAAAPARDGWAAYWRRSAGEPAPGRDRWRAAARPR